MNDAEVREHVLDEAKKCVLKDRNSTYGKPEDNFRRIAELWTAYLGIRPKDVGAPITPTDVAQMMLLMKVARLAHNPTHKDSWVDAAGYIACGAGIEIGENPKSDFQESIGPTGAVTMMYSGPGLPGKGIVKELVQEAQIAKMKELCNADAETSIPMAKKPDTVHIPGIGECVITKQSDLQDFMNIAKAIRRGEAKLQACQTPSTSSDSQS